MPDNLPGAEDAPSALPPPRHPSSSGRVVVTLSSVAKTPPPVMSSGVVAPPKQVPPLSDHSPRSGILPPKEAVAATQKRLTLAERQPQLNRTVEVKLPPKTNALPRLTSLASLPVSPAGARTGTLPAVPDSEATSLRVLPPPVPVKKEGMLAARLSPLKRFLPGKNPFSFGKSGGKAPVPPETRATKTELKPQPAKDTAEAKPPGWKHLEPGELPRPKAGLQSLESFARTEREHEDAKAPAPVLLPSAAPAPVLPPATPPPLPAPAAVVPEPLPDIPAAPATPPPSPPVAEPPAVLHAVPPLLGGNAPTHAEKFRLPPPLLQESKRDAPFAKAPALSTSGSQVPSPITVGPAIGQHPIPSAKPGAAPPPLPVRGPSESPVPIAPGGVRAPQPRTGKLAFIPESPEKASPPLSVVPDPSLDEKLPLLASKSGRLPPAAPAAPATSALEQFPPLPGASAKLPPLAPLESAAPLVENFPPLPAATVRPPPLASASPVPVPAVSPAPVLPPAAVKLPPVAPAAESFSSILAVSTSQALRKLHAPAPLETRPPVATAKAETPASTPRLKPPALPRANKPPEVETTAPAPEEPAVPALVLPVAAAVVAATVLPSKISESQPPTIHAPALKTSPVSPAAGVKSMPPPVVVPQIGEPVPPVPAIAAKGPTGRSARAKKRRLIGTIIFYTILVLGIAPALYLLAIHFSTETRVEGQVIPPSGTLLENEIWIVTDFRGLAAGIADDLAAERAPKLQEIQERQDHVQRAQADIAAREERIRLLQEQIQAAKDEITSLIKQSRDAAQRVWDGPGAALQDEYKTHLAQLQSAIADRAKSLNLKYEPDNTYQSPEVWANAYRLALYETPPGVDQVKEHQWIEDQLKQWRDFTKSLDDRQQKLRQQAAQIQLAPGPRVADLNGKVDDLQHRVDSTVAEEEPLKTELQQAQTDLAQSQTAEAGLDAKYYDQLNALPEQEIVGGSHGLRLPLAPDGRFSWRHLEKDTPFGEGEKSHSFFLFSRAIRPDGRQYWALSDFSIEKNTTVPLLMPPDSFVSTKAVLRPDLPPDEQQ